MADEQQRFLNYENHLLIYRSKTAMSLGTLYFNKGYQTTPVLGMQFAKCNDPEAEQKTFNWEAEEKSWYFPTYDKCFELFCKLGRWKRILMSLKEQRNTQNDEIQAKYKEYAEKQKIGNPVKKKSIYLSVRYYNGYYLNVAFVSKGESVSVSLTEDEFDMILQFIGDFIRNYHLLALTHRQTMITRGLTKESGGGPRTDGGNKNNSYSGGNKSSGSGGAKKSNGPPDDDGFGDSKPSGGTSKPSGAKSGGDSVDDLLNGSSLDDIMSGVNADDIPF